MGKVWELAALALACLLAAFSLRAEAAEDTLSFEHCERLNPPLSCPSGQNLSLSQQKAFVLEALFQGMLPAHSKIGKWNVGIEVADAPENVQMSNYEMVRNAWVNITAVMPSVRSGGQLFVDSSGTLRADYGYELALPEGYRNGAAETCGGHGRENEIGDCRTEYVSSKDASFLEFFQNGKLIGKESFARFSSQSENHFSAVLHARNKILQRHWKWEKGGCCRTCKSESGKYCCAFAYSCSFSGEDFRTDGVDLSDSVFARNSSAANFSGFSLVFDESRGFAVGHLAINTERAVSYRLAVGDAALKKRLLAYGVNYSFAPYNFLQLEAEDEPQFFVTNLELINSSAQGGVEKVSFRVLPSELGKCRLTVEGFFGTAVSDCSYSVLPRTVLKLGTDRFAYSANDSVKILVSLESGGVPVKGNVTVKYGSRVSSVLVDGKAAVEFAAMPRQDLIEAEYQSDWKFSSAYASKLIHVGGSAPVAFFLFLGAAALAALVIKIFHERVLEV